MGSFPVEQKFSEKTKGLYGFKDARVEIGVKKLLLPTLWLTITKEEIGEALVFLQNAKKFADMPEDERARIGAE